MGTFYRELALEQAGNIVKFYKQATDDEIEGGLVWYEQARTEAQQWASAYGVSLKQAAAVLAVLSPQTPWDKNKEYAWVAIQNFREANDHMDLFECGVRTIYQNIKKAFLILRDGDFSQLGGLKVRSFFHNIWTPESYEITHDVHSQRVVFNDTSIPSTSITAKHYRTAKMAYNLAQQVVQVNDRRVDMPYKLQAITWVVARRFKTEGVQSI